MVLIKRNSASAGVVSRRETWIEICASKLSMLLDPSSLVERRGLKCDGDTEREDDEVSSLVERRGLK